MPNNQLVDRILVLKAEAAPSETVVMKIAAALTKQINKDHDVFTDDLDPRLQIFSERSEWIPDRFEVIRGILILKDRGIPERITAGEAEISGGHGCWLEDQARVRH